MGLRGVDAPVAVARYTTGEMTLTDRPPPELKRALPDLPELASELSNIVDAANAIYDGDPGREEAGAGMKFNARRLSNGPLDKWLTSQHQVLSLADATAHAGAGIAPSAASSPATPAQIRLEPRSIFDSACRSSGLPIAANLRY
jgi:hypothetical protein